MQRFVAEQNIQRFKDMLDGEQDSARREVLKGMIAEEEAKLERLSQGQDPVRANPKHQDPTDSSDTP